MRFPLPHFPLEFEIPDDWLAEARFMNFKAATPAFRSIPGAVIVPLTEIEPVARFATTPKDRRGFDRTRLVSVLKGIISGAEIEPVPVTKIPFVDLAPSPYRYRVWNGYHRYYASIAAGFSGLPTTDA